MLLPGSDNNARLVSGALMFPQVGHSRNCLLMVPAQCSGLRGRLTSLVLHFVSWIAFHAGCAGLMTSCHSV